MISRLRNYLMTAEWDPGSVAAAISIPVSLTALILSIWFNSISYSRAQAEFTIGMVAGFADEHIVSASFTLLRAAAENQPDSEAELIQVMQETSPLRLHLKAMAACISTGVCERQMSLSVFCDRASVYEQIIERLWYNVYDKGVAETRRQPTGPYFDSVFLDCPTVELGTS